MGPWYVVVRTNDKPIKEEGFPECNRDYPLLVYADKGRAQAVVDGSPKELKVVKVGPI